MPAGAETATTIQSLSIGHAIFIGIAGGIIAEFMGLYKLRTLKLQDFPLYFTYPSYWIITVIMIAFGGLAVYLYAKSGIHFNSILALQVGATAPLILERMVGESPKLTPGSND